MKFFNTEGPINPKENYFLSRRLDFAQLFDLIERKRYFILHAPRQSGKTTAIKEFIEELNLQGNYKAFYINVEPVQASRGNIRLGMETLLTRFKGEILFRFGKNDPAIAYLEKEIANQAFSGSALQNFLQDWSQHSEKPIILFMDEIDSLIGDTLISVLRQLRAGYDNRSSAFPQSVCLLGVRDVRDYRIWSDEEQALVLGGSAFNIKAESLIIQNFSTEQIRQLYQQHTQETGQIFQEEVPSYVFEQTAGQPWLVNALAYQACFRDTTDRTIPISLGTMQKARDALVKRCDTHIDVLISRLEEPRVRRIIDAIISGSKEEADFPYDDVQYLRDLGLLAQDSYAIANPIYQEVIPRALIKTMQERIPQTMPSYLDADGLIDMSKLLAAFTQFFRENSGAWLKGFQYHESAPHLLLMAFLQRLINGGGTVTREYALDSQRVDLFIRWKSQVICLEIKIFYSDQTIKEGLLQLRSYIDKSGAEGHLILFDRTPGKSWEEKIFHLTENVGAKTIQVWGL